MVTKPSRLPKAHPLLPAFQSNGRGRCAGRAGPGKARQGPARPGKARRFRRGTWAARPGCRPAAPLVGGRLRHRDADTSRRARQHSPGRAHGAGGPPPGRPASVAGWARRRPALPTHTRDSRARLLSRRPGSRRGRDPGRGQSRTRMECRPERREGYALRLPGKLAQRTATPTPHTRGTARARSSSPQPVADGGAAGRPRMGCD